MANILQYFRNLQLKSIKKECFRFNRNILYNFGYSANAFFKRNYSGDCDEKDNCAVVLHGIKDLRIELRPFPKFKDHEVLLQMEVVGICGSDVQYYDHGRVGSFVLTKPMVIGHEASATVIKCGKDVKNLKPGDKVAVEPQINCGKCHFCETGRYHLCQDLFFCATPPHDGNLTTYWAHDARFCYKLPQNVDLEQGALMEPLAVSVHSCKRANITSGDTVLILGAGPIGLVSLMTARAYGAQTIVITDITNFKLHKADEMGADCAVKVAGLNEDEMMNLLLKALKGKRPRVTIYACSDESVLKTAIKLTESGGKVVLVGNPTNSPVPIPIDECVSREIDILGSFRYMNDYPTAIDLVSCGKVDPKEMVTHHFKMEDAVEAFEMASGKTEKFVKILIHANPNWTSKC
ncbi:hypothetical protein GWI33_020848 [Rhynchophorus ferrugineus]|uniref:Sorbitol dehydrogenase n=1 Tax=Rhynchophorus ferrugineus TaxID=354439 RepID=A0A834M5F9_RHYFE|nr:hypothetical protein GWI33_020848 [Rhynchophorus ferrugineus]